MTPEMLITTTRLLKKHTVNTTSYSHTCITLENAVQRYLTLSDINGLQVVGDSRLLMQSKTPAERHAAVFHSVHLLHHILLKGQRATTRLTATVTLSVSTPVGFIATSGGSSK